MSIDPTSPQIEHHSAERVKCDDCGMWNWTTANECYRCQTPLPHAAPIAPLEEPGEANGNGDAQLAEPVEETQIDEAPEVAPEVATGIDDVVAAGEVTDGPTESTRLPEEVPVGSFVDHAETILSARPAAFDTSGIEHSGAVPRDHAAAVRALGSAFASAVDRKAVEFVALVGPRDAGKGDVLRAFLADLGDRSTVLFSRIQRLRGSGLVSSWPIADLLEQGLGIGDDSTTDILRAIETFHEGLPPMVAEWTAGALSVPGYTPEPETSERALRQFLTTLARKGPLTIVIDDCDRLDLAFMRLLTTAASRVSQGSILVVLASETIPQGLSATKTRFEVVGVDPLPAEQIALGLSSLPADYTIDLAAGRPIAAIADHDVFLAEQTLVRQLETGSYEVADGVITPALGPAFITTPTIDEVLDEAIRRLAPDERLLLEAAAAAGTAVTAEDTAAVAELSDVAAATSTLGGLADRGYLARDPRGGDEAERYSFQSRALWERFDTSERPTVFARLHAAWANQLRARSEERPDRNAERIGGHLAAVWEARSKVGDALSPRADDGQASDALEAAANAAANVGDTGTAATLYERAASVLPRRDPRRARDVLAAGRLLHEAGNLRARPVANQAETMTREMPSAEATRARLLSASIALASEHDRADVALALADRSIKELERYDDNLGLAEAWELRAQVSRSRGHFAGAAAGYAAANEYARRASAVAQEATCLRALAWVTANGPTAVTPTINQLRGIAERVAGHVLAEQDVRGLLSVQLALSGAADEARTTIAVVLDILEDLGVDEETAIALHRGGKAAVLSDDHDEATALLARALAVAQEPRTRGRIAATSLQLALKMGDRERANHMREIAERDVVPDDIIAQVTWRSGNAKLLTQDERYEEADASARVAVQLAEQTDAEILRAEALADLGRVLLASGRASEAAPILARSLRTVERKGATVSIAAVRDLAPAPSSSATATPEDPGSPPPPELPPPPPDEPYGTP